MNTPNYKENINFYREKNPKLNFDEIGVLLTIDNLYKYLPRDSEINEFRRVYTHLDPKIIDSENIHGIKFLDIIKSEKNYNDMKKELNNYINIKFNHVKNFKSYSENMKLFKKKSKMVSSIIENILNRTKYPDEIINFLKESDEVKYCYDFFELIQLYKNTNSIRIKFEILRKVGIIILISRINRIFIHHELNYAFESIRNIIEEGLCLEKFKEDEVYFFLNEDENLIYSFDKEYVLTKYEELYTNGCSHFFVQNQKITSYLSKNDINILSVDFRNKFYDNKGMVDYTSIVEKMIRKNLEFPTQVHDAIGLRIVVKNSDDIYKIIGELEDFLGGSSTRKKEKDTINKFGKKKIGRYSSKEYYVWKAVYDVTIPHHNLELLDSLKKMFVGNNDVVKKIDNFYNSMNKVAKDVICEIQIQDFESYLLSKTNKSSTEHSYLKMNQTRKNSFYKIFPKEIYEKDLNNLKKSFLYR